VKILGGVLAQIEWKLRNPWGRKSDIRHQNAASTRPPPDVLDDSLVRPQYVPCCWGPV